MSDLAFVPHAAPLLSGVLLGRRKRFFADVRLESGESVVAHCVNTGRMEGLLTPGRRVFVSRARPGRKLAYTWELLELDTGLVGVNTIMANRLVRAVLEARVLRGLRRFSELSAEYPYGERSRVDFRLATPRREHFIEVKNCHLVYPDGAAYFPDAPSERAVRHLEELTRVVESGRSASVLFTVQRTDARRVRPSDVHDPTFAAAARLAARAGVGFRALAIRPTELGYRVLAELPVDLAPYDVAPVRRFRDALTAAP
ncbi:MAG: DNA/RNA nuclease SfsA [Myxococcales bacterium]|nr:DNA/RNA nuclease SfsA [Myxococcales bacterium]